MNKIVVFKQKEYPISENEIKDNLDKFLKSKKIINAEVSVAIVSEKKIESLAMKYMGESKQEAKGHPVLSFCEDEVESEFVAPTGSGKYLGEIIVSFEHSEKESENTGENIGKIICNWIEHGALHLLGIHHK